MTKLRFMAAWAIALIGLASNICEAQTADPSQAPPVSKQESISSAKLHTYLRQPGGIQKLSAEVGDVNLVDSEERWGESTLSSLIQGSDLIIVARVESSEGQLSDDGDTIFTVYGIRLQEALKGTPLKSLKVTVQGGSVTLSNGSHATVHTLFADSLISEKEYIFFLRGESGSLIPYENSVSVLQLDASADRVRMLDRVSEDRKIAGELSGKSIESVKAEIRRSSQSTVSR